MRIDPNMTDEALLTELGQRIARTRLSRDLSQSAVAEEAGVGLATVQRLERGRPVALASFLRVLRALDLLGLLEQAVPEPLPSPLEQLKLHGRLRQRAGRPRRGLPESQQQPWRWGDEGDGV